VAAWYTAYLVHSHGTVEKVDELIADKFRQIGDLARRTADTPDSRHDYLAWCAWRLFVDSSGFGDLETLLGEAMARITVLTKDVPEPGGVQSLAAADLLRAQSRLLIDLIPTSSHPPALARDAEGLAARAREPVQSFSEESALLDDAQATLYAIFDGAYLLAETSANQTYNG